MTSKIRNFCISKNQLAYLKTIDSRAIPDFDYMVDLLQKSKSYINLYNLYGHIVVKVDIDKTVSMSFIKNGNTHNVNITKEGKIYINGSKTS